VLARLGHPERVLFFDLPPNSNASTDVRARVAAGEPLDGLVPPAVAKLVAERRLYRPQAVDTLETSRSEDAKQP
jgi:nicotinic acid mononucleotide adenylyltransferase